MQQGLEVFFELGTQMEQPILAEGQDHSYIRLLRNISELLFIVGFQHTQIRHFSALKLHTAPHQL